MSTSQTPPPTETTFDKLRTISKKEIAAKLGLISGVRVRTEQLRKRLFTDDVLTRLGITPEQYQRIRTFTVLQTADILKLLQ